MVACSDPFATSRPQPHGERASTGSVYYLTPGSNVAAAVQNAPAGSTFHLAAGTYRMQSIVPKNGDHFIGAPGAVVSGARRLTTWDHSGALWSVGGQTQRGFISNFQCLPDHPACNLSQDLFIDDAIQRRVTRLSDVATGSWYFDTAAHRIYITTDPTNHRVETSVAPLAFSGPAANVTIDGLIVEKYATPAGNGAVAGDSGSAWIMRSSELRYNHGAGAVLGNGMQLLDSHVHHNGLDGVEARYVSDVLIQDNEISYNNTAGFHTYCCGGASKFWSTLRLTARGNYVHHNYGKGLWTDTDNRQTLYEQNTVTSNSDQGIYHEVSYSAVIRYNYVARNGFRNVNNVLSGAGILLASSSSVEIYGNTVVGNAHGIGIRQQTRGSGILGPWETHDVYVHDNDVSMSTGLTGMVVLDVADNSYFTSRNNRFERNTYSLGTLTQPFAWMGGTRTVAQWIAFGQDIQGVFGP